MKPDHSVHEARSWPAVDRRRFCARLPIIVLVLTLPGFLNVLTSDPAHREDVLRSSAWLTFTVVALAAGAMFAARWRLVDDVAIGWLGAIALMIGLHFVPFALHAAAAESDVMSPPTTAADIPADLLAIVFIWAAVRGVRFRGLLHPVVLGATCGVLLMVTRRALVGVDEHLGDRSPVIMGFLAVGLVPLCVGLWKLRAVSPWVRCSIAVTMAGITVTHRFALFDQADDWQGRAALIPVMVAVGTLLTATAVTLLIDAVKQYERRVESLAARASRAEADVHHDEEILHEVRATVAGVRSASSLLIDRALPPEDPRQQRLSRMLQAELRRLERLVNETRSTPQQVDLDALVEPLVVSLREQGAKVAFRPSGLTAYGSPDSISAAVHVLLCNAKRHAPEATITVTSQERDGHVIVRVTDDGPGVPHEMRETIFLRNAKGANSPGQGIGLSMAREVIRQEGGELVLEESQRGASFALAVPR